MCGHQWITHEDVVVCKRCGLTRTYDGKILFDRQFANVGKKVRKKRRKK